jgi:iron(III) transport system substrate-binding protein
MVVLSQTHCVKLLFTIAFLLVAGCSQSQRVVVVYTSQDQVYAEPLFARFEKETGIKVLPVFDSESIKTAGLVQRLLAERDNSRADVFWSNEEMLSHQLVEAGVLESNSWTKAGFRSRRLIVNTNNVALSEIKSLADLANPKYLGRVALAYPLYGTTAAHMVALRQNWGDAKWKKWCENVAANKPFVVDGNSVVVRLVGAGEAWLGLTDSDDLAAGQRNNLPIASISAGSDFLRIPNTIGIVSSAPHVNEAKAFQDFIRSEGALKELVAANALEGIEPAGCGLKYPAPVSETRDILKTIFARK